MLSVLMIVTDVLFTIKYCHT